MASSNNTAPLFTESIFGISGFRYNSKLDLTHIQFGPYTFPDLMFGFKFSGSIEHTLVNDASLFQLNYHVDDYFNAKLPEIDACLIFRTKASVLRTPRSNVLRVMSNVNLTKEFSGMPVGIYQAGGYTIVENTTTGPPRRDSSSPFPPYTQKVVYYLELLPWTETTPYPYNVVVPL